MNRASQLLQRLAIFGAILISLAGEGQNCTNLNFSLSNFTNWVGKTGTCCPITLTSTGIVAGRHTIISTAGTDPHSCGGLQMIPPGYTRSARLGNDNINSESEGLSYSMTVDSTNALFLFSYAPVVENPINHTTAEQPRFEIAIRDATGAMIQTCAYYIVYGNTATGFNTCGNVLWKDWTTNGVDLRNYIGQTIKLEFRTGDCSKGGHFGYAYIAGKCQPLHIISSFCVGNDTVNLTAPDGFTSYNWSTGQNTQKISIGNPVVGTNVICTLTSVSGCISNISILLAYNPASNPSFLVNDSTQCVNGNNFVFTNTSSINKGSMTYQWDFGDATFSTSTNPSKTYASNGTFTVKLKVTSDFGCIDSTMRNISVYSKPTPSFSINTLNQCITGNQYLFTNTSSITSGTLTQKWYFGDGDTSSAINPIKTYATSGTYSVKLISISSNGCLDSAMVDVIVYQPIPLFTINNTSQCLDNNSFSFTNTSTMVIGTLNYLWRFGDGSSSTLTNPIKTYANSGTYNVTLIATSTTGCKDSITRVVVVYPKPAAAFTVNNVNQCFTDNTFIFTNSSSISSGTKTYFWYFGDGDTSTALNPVKSYSAIGIYTVKLMVTSNFGCIDSITKTVQVFLPKPIFSINNANQCINGNLFIFNNTSTVVIGTLSYLWDFGDGDISIAKNPTKIYSVSGTYTVKLIVKSNTGCIDSTTKIVMVYTKPIPGFSFIDTFQCLSGNRFTFTNTSSIASGTMSYRWRFGDGDSSLAINPIKTYTSSGTYRVLLIAISSFGCIDTISSRVTVYPKPMPSFSTNSANQCLSGNAFVFTNTSTIMSGTLSYFWDFGDGKYAATPIATNSYSNIGAYNVKLRVTSEQGCLDSSTNTVYVWPHPIASFEVNDTSQCINNQWFVFTNQSTIPNGSITYEWNFGDGSSSTLKDPTKIYKTIGRFLVTLKAISDHGCTHISSSFVTVAPKPKTDFTFSPKRSLITDTFVLFSNTSMQGLHYYWDFGNGHSNSTFDYTSIRNEYLDTGTFQVMLIGVDDNGCSDTTLKPVYIHPVFFCHIPNVFSPNNDHLNDRFKPYCWYAKKYELSIWNRWGTEIYVSDKKETTPSWDGTYIGNKLSDDNFVYRIRIVDFENKVHNYNGIVTLLFY